MRARRREEEGACLEPSPQRPRLALPGERQAEQEGRHDEHAHRVAGPPHRPGGRQVGERDGAVDDEGRGTDRRAHEHRPEGTDEDDRQGVAPALELAAEADAVEQHHGEVGRGGVADRRHGRREQRVTDRQVDGEGRDGDGRPGAPTEDEQRGDGDAGGWPQRGDVGLRRPRARGRGGRSRSRPAPRAGAWRRAPGATAAPTRAYAGWPGRGPRSCLAATASPTCAHGRSLCMPGVVQGRSVRTVTRRARAERVGCSSSCVGWCRRVRASRARRRRSGRSCCRSSCRAGSARSRTTR